MVALLPALSLFLFYCADPIAAEPVEREVYLMGTSFRIALYEPDRAKGIRDLERLIEIVEQTEAELSNWRDSSDLSRFNQAEVLRPYAMSSPACDLFAKISEFVRMTGGAFDPAVGVLEDLWKRGDPKADQIQFALQNTGWRHIEMDGCQATKKRAVKVDAGAYGKGEAIDRVLQLAARIGMSPMLINFGGQIAVREMSSKIVLADPLRRERVAPVIVAIESGSVSTSGQSVQPQHILDPRTGHVAPAFGSVSVWHPHALEADIFSTALFVMGPKQGFDWATKNHIAACFLITEGERLQIHATEEFHRLMEEQ